MFDIVQHPTELCTVGLRFPGGGIMSMNAMANGCRLATRSFLQFVRRDVIREEFQVAVF